jgi:hypothetical protein
MAKQIMAYKKTAGRLRKPPRHAFIFQVEGQKPAKIWTTVKPAHENVTLTLTEADVRGAIKRDGQGDAQNCAGAVCARRHGSVFPHSVSGHFDWLYQRLYVADRNTPAGLPKSCVAYAHNDPVAKLFDSKAGLNKLLARLRKHGPMQIKLSPPVYVEREAGRPRGARNAAQSNRKASQNATPARISKFKAGWLKEATA